MSKNKNANSAVDTTAALNAEASAVSSAVATKVKKVRVPSAKAEAYKAKRAAKLAAAKAKSVNLFMMLVTFKELKTIESGLTWETYCNGKAAASANYWLERAKSGQAMNEKKKAKLAARIEKMKKMQAELEKMLAA